MKIFVKIVVSGQVSFPFMKYFVMCFPEALLERSIFPVVSILKPGIGKNLPFKLPDIIGLIVPF